MNPTTTMEGPTISTLNAGDNTYGSGANGISILEDVLTTPNGITLNSVGISYDSGTTITSNTWDDITTRIAYLSAIAPNNINPTILAVNDTISIQNADTAPTRVISTTAGASAFGIEWVGDGLPFLMATLDSTPLQIKDTTLELSDSITPLLTTMTASTLTSGASSASWASIITGASTTPSWNDTLTVSSTASQDINMNSNDILNCDNINLNTINNLTPTTIGLTWADFTGINAYNNLPSLGYQVFNGSSTTSQYADKFEVDAGGLFKNTMSVVGMSLFDTGSATTTTYGANNIQNTNATAFTITAGFGANQPLNLECSQLNINSVPYQPPRPVFWQGSSNSFMISAGSFQNVGTLLTLSLTANTAYILRYSLTIWNTIYDGTMNMYPQFYNSNGNYDSQTWSSIRPSNAISNNSAFAGATSQFIVNDWISFTADSNGQLLLDLYYGSSSSINGSYYWSFTGDILSP